MSLLLTLVFSCSKPEPEPVVEPLPFAISDTLLRIDSLMQHDADSALIMLMSFRPTEGSGEISYKFNDNYQSLLLAEALYKTYNPQLNRYKNETFQETSLQDAMHYFDSLAIHYPNYDDIAMFSARSHYMNGVGFYENDSVIEACKEYLHTLEIIEDQFDEKQLVGYKAKFMALTYGRLSDLFSAQFMMEASISCGENALKYCMINPPSKYSISNTLYRLGKQYDKIGDTDKTQYYYSLALEKLPDKNNPMYRDLVASLALSNYQPGNNFDGSLNSLKTIAKSAANEREKLTRALSIGYIYYAEHKYDSALAYFRPVFEVRNDMNLRIQAANYLRIIYDSVGDNFLSNEYANFIAKHQTARGKDHYLVSRLSDLYKDYNSKKKEDESIKKLNSAIKTTLVIFVIIVLSVIVTIVIIEKRKSNKRLYAERQVHRINQASMAGRLKHSNNEINQLRLKIKGQDFANSTGYRQEVSTLEEEPICILIMEIVNKGQFKSHIDYSLYRKYSLTKQQLSALKGAINRHNDNFLTKLIKQYPKLTKNDLDYCSLYILGLTEADVAALMQRAYNTVCYRSRKLKAIFGMNEPLSIILLNLANNLRNNTLENK